MPNLKPAVSLILSTNLKLTSTDAKKMEELIPNAGLAVIANAGHFCFLEQRVIFDRIMKSYFKIGE